MSLFQEVHNLYYRQMVAQLCISKEMSIFHNCFHCFVHPLYINSGTILLFPLCVFMGGTGTTLLFVFKFIFFSYETSSVNMGDKS